MLDQIAWLAAAVLTTSCAEVPPPAFEAELASFQCSGNDSRWYFRETYLTQDEFPACWRVAREVKGGCGARETYWTPQPGDYVPPLDHYHEVAPEPVEPEAPEVPDGG